MATIWEQCYDHQWCVHIPLDGNRCFGIHACVRVVEDSGSFFLELQLNGVVKRINLANVCVDLPVSIFDLKVCIANLFIGGIHTLIQFDISLDGCIKVDVGPIHLEECVNLTRQHVLIGKLSEAEREQFLAPVKPTLEPLYVFYSRAATQSEQKQLEDASQSDE